LTGIKVGDLVRVKQGTRLAPEDPLIMPPNAGIVIDLIEDDVGYSHAYVLFQEQKWWIFSNLLEVVDDV
tara:strand:- start:105 stop:311 length:207 start_codon:yes stop_codon:yes gene_type:complete